MILKFINFVMLLLFTLSVLVQYNDPDPVSWMLIYGAGCAICILFAMKKMRWTLLGGALVAAVSGILVLFKIPDLTVNGFRHMLDDVHMTQQGVEAAREFLGLLIIVVWVLILAFFAYRGGARGHKVESDQT
jgi:hypothetical protein